MSSISIIDKKVKDFIKRAGDGESVYIYEVRDAFEEEGSSVECIVETTTNEHKKWQIPLPKIKGKKEKEFVSNYFFSTIYNIISTYGGKEMTLNLPNGELHIRELCNALNDVFQVNRNRIDRSGYGKCINVTDRINAAFGHSPFKFNISESSKNYVNKAKAGTYNANAEKDAVSLFQRTVKATSSLVLIGLDIGGTDIKAVSVVNGKISSFTEFDWNPTRMIKIEQMTDSIKSVMNEMCAKLGKSNIPDGVGVGFPDVVIMNKIVGGETFKTRGIRNKSQDYESEFAKLLDLNEILLSYCKPNAVINMTNDGSLAAYTAAVELAHSNRGVDVTEGVFAHTLGTELGSGWIDENGEIPQIPLEIYNCVIDLGNYPARKFKPFDLRSTLNFNTEIAGTMQKYASQSGAYRLALEYFKKDAPGLYNELFTRGFIEEKNNGVYVIVSPKDMRKPLLEYIMKLADEGEPQAEKVFKEIGGYLAATLRETEFLLSPKAKKRILYGRFVKSQKCLKLMQEGVKQSTCPPASPSVFSAGDDTLAYTPLMRSLKDNPDYTVAQFGQAIGAVYFAAFAK